MSLYSHSQQNKLASNNKLMYMLLYIEIDLFSNKRRLDQVNYTNVLIESLKYP